MSLLVMLLCEGSLVTESQLYDCGTLSVRNFLALHGKSVPLHVITEKLPTPCPDGFTIKQFRDAIRSLGIKVNGVKIPRQAKALDREMLMLLKHDTHGHYVVIRPVGPSGTLIQIVDGLEPPRVLEKTKLVDGESWTGIVLSTYQDNESGVSSSFRGPSSTLWRRGRVTQSCRSPYDPFLDADGLSG